MLKEMVGIMTHIDELALRAKTAFGRLKQSRAEWIAASLDLGAVLKEARERFSSNEVFGAWLRNNGIFLSKDDRSGLLRLAANPEAARKILEDSSLESWRSAARQLQCRFPTTLSRSSQPAKMHPPRLMIGLDAEGTKVHRLVDTAPRNGEPRPRLSINSRPNDLPEATAKLHQSYEAKVVAALAAFCGALRYPLSTPDPTRVVEIWALTRSESLWPEELRNLASWLEAVAQAVESAPKAETSASARH